MQSLRIKYIYSVLPLIALLFFITAIIFLTLHVETAHAVQSTNQDAHVYVFGRDDCGYCKKELKWLEEAQVPFTYLNIITDEHAAKLFAAIIEKHETAKVTPLTIVGDRAMVGFNGAETTGARILSALKSAELSTIRTPEEHLLHAPKQDVVAGGGCDASQCDTTRPEYLFTLPILGTVDLKSFSLVTLSSILGVVDGFNPCAMWVLITFMVLLLQAGSRKKMIVLAGVFILAEALMYNLILNVWFTTWDFVALDQIVTPIVGLLALGGGVFFLYRWYQKKDAELVCDISSFEQQSRILSAFESIAKKPLTLVTFLSIITIAFSVNIIEFACSIGIPQAYTKILELNALSFLERQWYMFIYTIGYMVDDFIVFGLAIWGYSRLEAHGQRYAQYSLLVGGILMLLLGAILIFSPTVLVL